ncbi:S26 family signal peptidase [Labedaea rhizosphaerae]|uniref:Signal peptidase I n=1 Tax=Labedaea rhizosphaerae TaxID=598644 RepID=A0A4V3CZS7_LABRH|nr:S26 family signal peptidase [Labedaea rhizosphaerae]TDQ00871.1 signal peptidase I [Labedaea rhizosphaerae]
MIRLLLLVSTLLLVVRRSLVVTTVDGDSMAPGLRSGDRVLVRRTRRVRRGQVVMLGYPPVPSGADTTGQYLLKRVVAVTGDRLDDGWAAPDVAGLGGQVVPPGCAVVLGDNRPSSWDSRHYGFVPGERVVGVVVRKL